jgi:hypothetical protein
MLSRMDGDYEYKSYTVRLAVYKEPNRVGVSLPYLNISFLFTI